MDDPALMKTAVEEALRFESSNQLGNRSVTQDVTLGGVAMPRAPGHHLHRRGEPRPSNFPIPIASTWRATPTAISPSAPASICAPG